jgi:hypothetical protein
MRAARPFEEESICTAGRPQEALQLPYEISGSSLGPAASDELIMPTTTQALRKQSRRAFSYPHLACPEVLRALKSCFPCKSALPKSHLYLEGSQT